eukprot:c20292_g1_i1 orf=193-831(+)
MDDSPQRNSRYSESPPRRRHSRSRSPPRRENGDDAINPGNNLYIAGLSARVTEKDLEEHLSKEGKVTECRLVVDSRTRESRGFGFVTMESIEDAERCIKYLNRSTLEGRIITVEKARRRRARTPTPGEYLGLRAALYPRTRGYGDYGRGGYGSRRSSQYSPYRGDRYRDRDRDRYRDRDRDSDRDRSPRYSPYRGGSKREQSYSPRSSPYRR